MRYCSGILGMTIASSGFCGVPDVLWPETSQQTQYIRHGDWVPGCLSQQQGYD